MYCSPILPIFLYRCRGLLYRGPQIIQYETIYSNKPTVTSPRLDGDPLVSNQNLGVPNFLGSPKWLEKQPQPYHLNWCKLSMHQYVLRHFIDILVVVDNRGPTIMVKHHGNMNHRYTTLLWMVSRSWSGLRVVTAAIDDQDHDHPSQPFHTANVHDYIWDGWRAACPNTCTHILLVLNLPVCHHQTVESTGVTDDNPQQTLTDSYEAGCGHFTLFVVYCPVFLAIAITIH